MAKKALILTTKLIQDYTAYLREQERAEATIQKYTHDLMALCVYLDGAVITKTALLDWKEKLTGTHAPTSVNS